MNTDISPPKAKWPTVICVISIIYVLLYAALYVRLPRPEAGLFASFSSWAICLFLLSGSIGVGIRRKWAVSLILSGSVLVLIMALFSIFSIMRALGGTPPVIAILGILTFMLPTLIWPVFLLVWFSRGRTKSTVKDQWT